uniref:Uncharacterized protein n=1 Tax=Opuntia streptacantha TaxID=393608 RepID=A0A7C9DD86_OPUST
MLENQWLVGSPLCSLHALVVLLFSCCSFISFFFISELGACLGSLVDVIAACCVSFLFNSKQVPCLPSLLIVTAGSPFCFFASLHASDFASLMDIVVACCFLFVSVTVGFMSLGATH